MSAVIDPKRSSDPKPIELESLKTTVVDQVASLLLSMVIMIGLAVLMLGALYYLATMKPRTGEIIILPENIAGRGENAAGFERDLEPPSAEEVEQLTEPTIDQTLQSISEAVNSLTTSLDTMANGSGKGDSRPPGPEGEGDDIIPRFERWELRFSARDSKGYAAQLEFFKIELAAVGGGIDHVDYVSDLTGKLQTRKGPGEAEKRLYFINRREGPLLKYERDLLTKSKISTSGRQVLKLIPKELEDSLATLEMLYARKERGPNVSAKEFAKTIFDCQPTSKGFEWVVVEQRYRLPARK